MKFKSTARPLKTKAKMPLLIGLFMFLFNTASMAQLGVYTFSGPGNCPNQNPAVSTQPANAVFSDFTSVNSTCDDEDNAFKSKDLNGNSSIDLGQYYQFSITPNGGFLLNLTSISFRHICDDDDNTTWVMRSSLDNYSENIGTGTVTTNYQSPSVVLPQGIFGNIATTVTFRIYIIHIHSNGSRWIIDDVTVNGLVSAQTVATPLIAGNPVSNSPQCSGTGVTMSFTGTAPAGETWYWQTSETGTSTASSAATALITSPGTYYVRAQNNTTLDWGAISAPVTISFLQEVSMPVFTAGTSSTRCEGQETAYYSATADNNTGITYSIDPDSYNAGNSIDPNNGTLIYASNWVGTTVVRATATGCDGPKTAIHTVTILPSVDLPVFALGSTSGRCQATETITYAATASNNTGMTYGLDATSLAAGVTIDTASGAVNFPADWSGVSTITASASGCNGPVTTTHSVSTTSTIGVPVFSAGLSSERCQGMTASTYDATATNSIVIQYSLDAASIAGGNTINEMSGEVNFAAAWTGVSTITATASGCNGPTVATFTVTSTPNVEIPVFAQGPTSTMCQGVPTATYTATSANSTGITYSLDAASIAGGNSIDASTGAVSFAASWNGTTTITASAAGCNGPLTATHIITMNNNVGTPVFALGSMSVRTQGAGTTTYTAATNNNAVVTYSLDAASITGGNTINATTGTVTWASSWNGTSMVTANSSGCTGSVSATHIITINASVAQTPLYLSTGQTLDRIDPVATGITTTLLAPTLSTGSTNNVSFTQSTALSANLVIKAQTISVVLYVGINSGTMPASPSITALLKYGNTNILSLTNPIYNSATGLLTWTKTLGADVTVPSGEAIVLNIKTTQSGVSFTINYHSMTKPSRISLLPVSTFIDITSFDTYSAAYPGGTIRTAASTNMITYARAVATTPFGYKDITGLSLKVIPQGLNVNAVCVDSTAGSRTYEYAWTPPATPGTYYLMATAKEGYESIIINSELLGYSICSVCPPVAVSDSATGAGGSPITLNVLANDYDPNNNLKASTLSIATQPYNGTGYISNGKVVYLPNGSFAGRDTLVYRICDSTGLCGTGMAFFTVDPFIVDPCAEATKTHVYYLPFSENEARISLDSSTNTALASNNIRTVISLKMPYPGMVLVWDHWEDGYEVNALSPIQSTTMVWGDGNPYNGIAPGYNDDIIPAGGSIVLDNTIPTKPRVSSNFFYDGRDKITASGQLTVTQVCGEPSIMAVQCMKTNVSPTIDYGTSFTIPAGQNFPSQDFRYSSLFIRAAQNNTTISIDKDNNGTLETTATINEGEVMHINGGVRSGATVTATAPIGVELHFGGNDNYSSRDVPIYPATWYSNIYYSPVPTTGRASTPRDTAVVMLYNSLNRAITINWSSGIPSSGTVTLPAKTVVRFPLAMSQTAAYKFVNPTGESFTAIQICDSYTPGGGANIGQDYDWSFNLIAQNRLTDFATIAWAPGSLDGTRNDNPVWVAATNSTTIYVKYDGKVSGTTGSVSPCGLRYDVSYALSALNHKRILDPNDKDQSGIAVFTCDGTKLAAVYGEDASTAVQGSPSWDVGSTIQPFCKQKLIFANDDYSRTMINQPVTISILLNDFGFLSVIDPTSVTTAGYLQPKHGTVTINANGTILYTPDSGYVGRDTFQYSVCSTPTPVVCDDATVYVDISVCPSPYNENVIAGKIFNDKNKDGLNNDGGDGVAGGKVYLYVDGNCNTLAESNELKDSVTVDASGTYQFTTYPEKFVADDFNDPSGARTCANGSDGNTSWLTNWADAGDLSVGFCNSLLPTASTDAEITKDGAFGYALRLKDKNISATRTVNLNGSSYAFLTFSYRRKSASLTAGKNVIVQASNNGSTFGTIFTIKGDGTTDAGYVTIYNQDITAYASATTYLRFLTNSSVGESDTVYIDNVKIQYLAYPLCYVTKLDPASVPANYHTTTVTQRNITAANSTACISPGDFGITKNGVSISGTLYNDPNGLMDNQVNGTAIGLISSLGMNAYLVDSTGKVVLKTIVNPLNGTYTFPVADVQTNYKVVLSTVTVNTGILAPLSVNLNSAWTTTGDAFGINNMAGTGIKPGIACASVSAMTATSNMTAVNFGIERLPNTDDKLVSYALNTPGLQYSIPAFSGSDPEDGTLGAGKTFKITSLPTNAVLLYNGVAVTLNQVIPSYTASLLKIDPIDGIFTATFTYAAMDAAGLYDPTPATVQVTWLTLLPISLLDFNGKLNGTKVDLVWKTSSESNSNHFEVERSNDGQEYKPLANVKAKGTSTTQSDYACVDPLPLKGINYYRLKMVDNDASFVYSKIINIKINADATLETRVMPNPFTGKLDIYLTLPHACTVSFRFVDINGKVVYSKKVKGLKGFNWFVVNDLEKLSSAPYILHLETDEKTFTQKLLKQ